MGTKTQEAMLNGHIWDLVGGLGKEEREEECGQSNNRVKFRKQSMRPDITFLRGTSVP